MTIEQITYGIKTVGHDNPEPERRIMQANDPVGKALEQWLESLKERDGTKVDQKYSRAVVGIKDISVTVEAAHAAVLARVAHPRIHEAGLFLSAVYNKVPDEVIVFDLDLGRELRGLGYNLPASKIVIFAAKTSPVDVNAYRAYGIIINYGHLRVVSSPGLLERKSSCLTLVNYGTVGIMALYGVEVGINFDTIDDTYLMYSSFARIMNFGNMKKIGSMHSGAIVINTSKQSPEVAEPHGGLMINLKRNKQVVQIAGTDGPFKRRCNMPDLVALVNTIMQDFSPGKQDYQKAVIAVKKHARTLGAQIGTEVNKYFTP